MQPQTQPPTQPPPTQPSTTQPPPMQPPTQQPAQQPTPQPSPPPTMPPPVFPQQVLPQTPTPTPMHVNVMQLNTANYWSYLEAPPPLQQAMVEHSCRALRDARPASPQRSSASCGTCSSAQWAGRLLSCHPHRRVGRRLALVIDNVKCFRRFTSDVIII